MKYLKIGDVLGKKFIYSLCFFFLMAGAAVAQQQQLPQTQEQQPVREDFSEAELEQFADVYIQVVEIQQQSEAEMMKAIEEENLDINRFNEILQAQQQRQGAEDINASADEMAAFNNAAQKIMGVQQETESEMQQLIEQDLGVETYQQIIIAYQQSPEVQQKVNELLQNRVN